MSGSALSLCSAADDAVVLDIDARIEQGQRREPGGSPRIADEFRPAAVLVLFALEVADAGVDGLADFLGREFGPRKRYKRSKRAFPRGAKGPRDVSCEGSERFEWGQSYPKYNTRVGQALRA